MSSWFNQPKDGSKFGSISLSESAKVIFSEAIIKDTENFVQVAGMITACSEIVDISNKDRSPLPCLATLRVLKKNWTSTFNGKDKEYRATLASKFIAEQLLGFGVDKPVKGEFDLSCPDAMVEALQTGEYEGQKLDPLQMKMMRSSYLKLEPTELTQFKIEDVPIPQSGGNGGKGGYRGQSKKQQILDRFEAVKILLGPGFEGCNTIIDLDLMLNELGSKDTRDSLVQLIQILTV